MSSNYRRIADRYAKGFVTDAQLDRYVALEVITAAEAEEIRAVIEQ